MLTTVLVDRDGPLGGDGHYTSVADFRPYPGVLAAIQALHEAGLRVLAVTNQTKIATGEMQTADLVASLRAMGLDDCFVCPHLPSAHCRCRKPEIGLIEQAQARYHFVQGEAVLIGDSYQADMLCAKQANLLGIHVATGRGAANPIASQCFEAKDFVQAVGMLVNHQID